MKQKLLHATLALSMLCSAFLPTTAVFASEPVHASESDFNGVWKCDALSIFGIQLDAADYGVENSFLTIQDGKISACSVSAYEETTDTQEFDLDYHDGVYSLALDENLMAKAEEKAESLDAEDSAILDKVKELTSGNSSRVDFELLDDGKLEATVYVDIQNDLLTFATHMSVDFTKSSQEELDAAISDASNYGDYEDTNTFEAIE